MRHWIAYIVVVVIVVIGGGGWYLEHMVTQRVGDQVVAMLSNASVDNQINNLLNQVDTNSLGGLSQGAGPSTANNTVSNSAVGNSSPGQSDNTAPQTNNSEAGQSQTTAGADNGSSKSNQQSDASGKSSGASNQTASRSSSNSAGGKTSKGKTTNSSGTSGSSNGTSTTTGSTSKIPDFTSRAQVIRYAMSHFTKTEIAHYTQLYLHKASLTPQQKEQIKLQILSHFTPAEVKAIEAAIQKYPN